MRIKEVFCDSGLDIGLQLLYHTRLTRSLNRVLLDAARCFFVVVVVVVVVHGGASSCCCLTLAFMALNGLLYVPHRYFVFEKVIRARSLTRTSSGRRCVL